MQVKSLTMLPPPSHCCQECATEHDPEQPHNPQSLTYAFWFVNTYGRSHTWVDAMAHCSEEVKALWLKHLSGLGIDPNSTNITGKVTQEKLDIYIESAASEPEGGHE